MLDSSVAGTRYQSDSKYVLFSKMLDFVYFSGNAWVSCSLALVPYKFSRVKHCIYNFPCEMITPLLNTYNTFPTSAGVLLSTKTLSPTYSSASFLLFLPITYMPVAEYCGTCPQSSESAVLLLRGPCASGTLRHSILLL